MLKVKIRKAKPLPFPKLKEGEIMDPTLELERDCTHVCEVEVDGQKAKKFVGNSRKEAYQQFIDHMSFSIDAYCEVLYPEKPASPAKADVIKRQLTHAGFKVPAELEKASKLPKPPQHLEQTETSKARKKALKAKNPEPEKVK